jgi:hypothetical protein
MLLKIQIQVEPNAFYMTCWTNLREKKKKKKPKLLTKKPSNKTQAST